MVHRIARPAGTLALALALASVGGPAIAATHHRHETRHHATVHHHTSRHATAHQTDRGGAHRGTPAHRSAKAAPHGDAAPSGAARVPTGGIKLFCPARSNPLLIRKSTQGAGTTVTLVCH